MDEEYQRMLFRTAVLVMACDGEIHADELRELKLARESTKYFSGVDFENEVTQIRDELGRDKVGTLRSHFGQLKELDLDPASGLQMLELVLRIIYADQRVDENEVRFCQLLQQILRVPEPVIQERFGSIPFLAASGSTQRKFDLELIPNVADRLSIPAQEDFNQLVD